MPGGSADRSSWGKGIGISDRSGEHEVVPLAPVSAIAVLWCKGVGLQEDARVVAKRKSFTLSLKASARPDRLEVPGFPAVLPPIVLVLVALT